MNPEPVAILGGTGPQGRGLAVRLARAGCRVVIGSRDAQKAQDAAAPLGGGVTGAGNADAATSAEVVFVAVPWDAHEPTLRSLAGELAGRIVVDLVNPITFDERGPVGLPVAAGSSAEQAQALLPASIVVSGFHHVSAKLLLSAADEVDTDVMICGDDLAAKERILALARLIPGVRAVDAGPLRLARFLEGMTSVLLSVNRQYKTTTGIRLTQLDI
ncbi:MAG: NADPH-dependent F420 reductase [Acidimicrobiales bacterium]